jgi:hypothetical protein
MSLTRTDESAILKLLLEKGSRKMHPSRYHSLQYEPQPRRQPRQQPHPQRRQQRPQGHHDQGHLVL